MGRSCRWADRANDRIEPVAASSQGTMPRQWTVGASGQRRRNGQIEPMDRSCQWTDRASGQHRASGQIVPVGSVEAVDSIEPVGRSCRWAASKPWIGVSHEPARVPIIRSCQWSDHARGSIVPCQGTDHAKGRSSKTWMVFFGFPVSGHGAPPRPNIASQVTPLARPEPGCFLSMSFCAELCSDQPKLPAAHLKAGVGPAASWHSGWTRGGDEIRCRPWNHPATSDSDNHEPVLRQWPATCQEPAQVPEQRSCRSSDRARGQYQGRDQPCANGQIAPVVRSRQWSAPSQWTGLSTWAASCQEAARVPEQRSCS